MGGDFLTGHFLLLLQGHMELTASRAHNGTVLKVKMSMQWDNGTFAFEQIRDEEYDYLVMLGITPHGLVIWTVPKDVALKNSQVQHAEESRWVRFAAATPPLWLWPYGDDPSSGLNNMKKALRV